MINLIFTNLLITLSIIFRFWGIKLTQRALVSGKYTEVNPFSRLLLKNPRNIYFYCIYNVIGFVLEIILFNIFFLLFITLSIEYKIPMIVVISFQFIVILIDFLQNFMCLKKDGRK